MTITSKMRRILAAAAATLAVMAVGLQAAQADASVGILTPGYLSIQPVSGASGVQSVQVQQGAVYMSPTEAQSLINQRYNIVIRLWGDDEFSDDLRLGPYSPDELYAGFAGLMFKTTKQVGNSVLNEDWGDDEIYAGLRLVKPDSTTVRSATSNVVHGSW